MPTLTVSPDAHPESATFDGYVQRSGVSETYATITGGNGVSVDDTGADLEIRLISNSTSNRYSLLRKALLLFDASALVTDDTITAARLRLYGNTKNSGLGNLALGVYGVTTVSDTGAMAADYQNIGATRLDSSSLDTDTWNAAGWNEFELNASGLAEISKTGVTRLAVQILPGATPTWASLQTSRVHADSADNGSGNAPELEIDYTTTFDIEIGTVASTITLPQGVVSYGYSIEIGTVSLAITLPSLTSQSPAVLGLRVEAVTPTSITLSADVPTQVRVSANAVTKITAVETS